MKPLVEVECSFIDASWNELGGSITAVPVVAAVMLLEDGEYATVTRGRVVAGDSGDGRLRMRLFDSYDYGWMTSGPMLYRFTEEAVGDNRTYYAWIEGPGPVDLALVEKWSTVQAPPIPMPDSYRLKEEGKKPSLRSKEDLVAVHGRYCDASSEPPVGTVRARPMQLGTDRTPRPVIVTKKAVAAELGSDGRFEMGLIPSDHPGWLIGGPMMLYRFAEDIPGLQRSWCAEVVSGARLDVSLHRDIGSCLDIVAPMLGRS